MDILIDLADVGMYAVPVGEETRRRLKGRSGWRVQPRQ
jgi:hypothetical protein